MEQTNTKNSGKLILWIIVIIVVIIGLVLFIGKKAKAPVDNNSISQASQDKSQMEADVAGAMNFDNESSLNAIDKEFGK